jgi:hypothetical protein
MKLVNKLTIVGALVGFMFAGGISITWGNAYTNSNADVLTADNSFGVWMNVNDATSFGWENGLKVGFAGPAGTTMRLGFDPSEATPADVNTTLGVSRSWWTSAGSGWVTNLSTAVDWNMTGDDTETGTFKITMNLGFGF